MSPIRMHGRALPERVVVLQFRKQQREYREDVLLPRRISGHEGIGRLFEYRIEAIESVPHPVYFPRDETEIDLHAIKGSLVTLVFNGVYAQERSWRYTGAREISGMVASVGMLGTEGNGVVYELVLRPRWWRATPGKNSRVFTNMGIREILHTVLMRYGSAIDFRIGSDAEYKRDFIRQAWETDWDFCMRLCEEFGYLVWFEHRNDEHVLVIADGIRACREHRVPYETLSYRPDGGHLDRE